MQCTKQSSCSSTKNAFLRAVSAPTGVLVLKIHVLNILERGSGNACHASLSEVVDENVVIAADLFVGAAALFDHILH